MTPKEFFNNQISTDANKCFVDIHAHKYERNDLFVFAEAYHKARLKEEEKTVSDDVDSRLAFISGLLQGMNSYLHEKLK